MEVPCEVEVDFLHRYDLAIATPGSASFDSKYWSEAGLAEAQYWIALSKGESVG